uniref:Zinc knuckle CX2CX4HX4C n=1 Tax=Tanacetum cinerariifolium TaxID=118510 RepID=A0A6L2K4B5_TANCI|nr:zinc knuckle CX2CX4HX4C [Tanacetum cinerariifolium]
MRDPESKNPSSSMHAKASDEFIKPKKVTRNFIGKPQLSTGMKHSRRVLFKADSRSCGESVSKKDVQVSLESEMVSDLCENYPKINSVFKSSGYGLGNVNELGPMPVPVEENPILCPRVSPEGNPRILRRGEALVDDGSPSNAAFSFNKIEKWPKVGSVSKNGCGAINDEEIKDRSDEKKFGSFISDVQGMSQSGNNKLKCILARVNELGKEVVDMDPVIKEGKAISRTASRIWNPIIIDRITTSMCKKAYGRASFDRVLIKVEAAKGVVDSVEVCYKALGRSMEISVEYPWKPPVCSHCKVFSHSYDTYTSRVLSDVEQITRIVIKAQDANVSVSNSGGEWQTVNNRRYTRFGNENGNIGFNRQRFNNGEGSSKGGYEGRGRVVSDSGNKGVKNDRGKSKMDVDSNGSNLNNIDGMGSRNTSNGDKNAKKKNNKKNEVVSRNVYSALSEEVDVEREIDYDAMKAIIDKACEKSLNISIKERENWPEEVMGYYKMKIQELVKKSAVKDLEVKIANLDRQIAHSSNMVAIQSSNKAKSMRIKDMILEKLFAEAEVFLKTRQVFTKHELDTWPDEKIEFYKSSIGDDAYKKILQEIKKGNIASMDEEVAEDLRNEAWVVLGDFNVVLRFNENSSGLNVQGAGTQDTIYEVEDANNLFTKRLDADKAIDLIKNVTNEVIKEAIFSIEDNKASCPDGYSSKFFKVAWPVNRKDVCTAIKEFFASGKLLAQMDVYGYFHRWITMIWVPVSYETFCSFIEEAARRVNLEELHATMQSSMAATSFDPSVFRKATRVSSNLSFEYNRGESFRAGLKVNHNMEVHAISIGESTLERLMMNPSSMSFKSLGVNEAMESNVPYIKDSNLSGSSELNSFSSFPEGDNVSVSGFAARTSKNPNVGGDSNTQNVFANMNNQSPKPIEPVWNMGGDFVTANHVEKPNELNIESPIVHDATISVEPNAKGFFYFKFNSRVGLESVLEGGPWMTRNNPIILKKWAMNTSLLKEELNHVPIWVKFHNVPLEVFDEEGISIIGSHIGKPIMLDAYTSSMCKHSWGRSSFAGCLIEVSLDEPLKDSFTMKEKDVVDSGMMKMANISYHNPFAVLGEDDEEEVRSRWKWTSNGSLYSKGSQIIHGWNDDLVDVMIMAQTNQVMHVHVNTRLMRNRRWVLLGDFNTAFNLEDHSAGGYEPNMAM